MTEKITTAEELDALPVGSVVLDRDNTAWQKVEGGAWVAPDDLDEGWPSEDLSEERPRFLYRPDAPAPSAEDFDVQQSDDGITRADEDREALAEFLFWRWREGHPGSLTWESYGEPKARFYEQADAALAWFATRQPAPTVSAEQVTATALVALSEWIDAGNAGRDPEAITWGRLAKITEEAGEVIAAYIGATGQNPRKGVTHTRANVGDELLDVAITALGAYEHLTQHQGVALDHLAAKIAAVAVRAGVTPRG